MQKGVDCKLPKRLDLSDICQLHHLIICTLFSCPNVIMITGVSRSEPHISKLNGGFFIYIYIYIYIYITETFSGCATHVACPGNLAEQHTFLVTTVSRIIDKLQGQRQLF